MKITSASLASSGRRRFSGEMAHALLSGTEFRVHFSRLITNGESSKELETKVQNSLVYQARKGRLGPELRKHLSILEETGKCWETVVDEKGKEVIVKEAKS